MKLLIDDANTELIEKICEYYPIDGVTTNPSILAKELAKTSKKPYDLLKEIRQIIKGKELHIQVISKNAEGMLKEADKIVSELGENARVKVPCVPEGFKAMKKMSQSGIKITATAIYTPLQAYLAAKSGADYAAPYVNRIDNMGYDGVKTTKAICDIFKSNGFKTEVLAASFKNSQQVLELCKYGVGAVTVAPGVIEGFTKNAAVYSAVDDFVNDFANVCGKNTDMTNC